MDAEQKMKLLVESLEEISFFKSKSKANLAHVEKLSLKELEPEIGVFSKLVMLHEAEIRMRK